MSRDPCPYSSLSDYDWSLTGPYNPPPGCGLIPWNPVVYSLHAAFQGANVWLGLDLTICIINRFNRRSLYYWTMLISTWGSLIFSAAVILAYFNNQGVVATVLLNVGWVPMVTGFSLVLYSRLHLLRPERKVLRIVLGAIIIDAILFHVPVIVTTIVVNVDYSDTANRIYEGFSFTEIAFSVQETAIATLYIFLFRRFTAESRAEPSTKATFRRLLAAQSIVLAVDIILNVLLFRHDYLARITIQAFTSLLKLKIEFVVLNSLIEFAHTKNNGELRHLHNETAEPNTPVNSGMATTSHVISESTAVEEAHPGTSAEKGDVMDRSTMC